MNKKKLWVIKVMNAAGKLPVPYSLLMEDSKNSTI